MTALLVAVVLAGSVPPSLPDAHRTPATAPAPPTQERSRPAPPSSRAPTPWDGSTAFWEPLVREYFPPAAVASALAIIECESGGNPHAKNPRSSAAGLFQFLESTWDEVAPPLGAGSYDSGAVFLPAWNVAAGAAYSAGGSDWSRWECSP